LPGPGTLLASTVETSYADVGLPGGYYKLTATDRNGNEGPYALVGPGQTTDVPVEPAVTFAFALDGVRPNPAPGGRFMVHFSLPGSDAARLEVFDVAGRRLKVLEVGSFGPGRHAVDLDSSRRLASGVYFIRLTQGGMVKVARQVILD
jgi:hypothetical protein